MPDRIHLEGLLRQIVEGAPHAMVTINASGLVTMVNAQAEVAFGYERNEVLGQPVEILMPERFRSRHPGSRAGFVGSPRVRPMASDQELYALRKDGSEFPVEIGLTPIDTEKGPMVISTIVDVSHRKAEEERLRAALREKDVLLDEVHHRVKNYLQIVCSLLGLQAARTTDPAMRNLLRDSQNRVHSMALTHQTLYQSRDLTRVEFALFIDALLPLLTGSCGADPRRISVRADIDPIRLPIDAAVPIGLVFNELITNAVRHAFRGRPEGEISVSLSLRPDNEALLSVSDDGIGLPDDLDTATPDTLGLQLVKLLAAQVDGTITVHRANPTRFSLRFPIHDNPEAP